MDEEKKDIEKLVEDAKKAVEQELNQNEEQEKQVEKNDSKIASTEEKNEYKTVKIKKKKSIIIEQTASLNLLRENIIICINMQEEKTL